MQIKTPLIVRLPNWMGDVIMTLPSLQTLDLMGFDLRLFGQNWIHDLLQMFPATLAKIPPSSREACQVFRRNTASNALLFTNSFSSALSLRLAGKTTIGYKNSFRNPLLSKKISKAHALHEVEYFWEIAKLAATTCLPHASWPELIPSKITLPVNPENRAKITARLKQEKITEPFIVLCPAATGTAKNGASKIWPYWSELSNQLAQHGIIHLVCPGPREETRCRQATPKAKCLVDLNLSDLAALFQQANYVIANDSGPMHLADAVGAKVLGIFGATDPKRTRPWGGTYLGDLGKWPSTEVVLEKIFEGINHHV